MLRIIRRIWATVTFGLSLLAIFTLSDTLDAVGDSRLPGWFNQTTLHWTFSVFALLYIAGMDARPLLDNALKQRRYRKAMNRPDGWSLSFAGGTGFQFVRGPYNEISPHYYTVLVQGVRIHNLSAERSRMLDLGIRFPGLSEDGALVEMTPRRSQKDEQFQFPLEIAPDGNVSGDIEFEIPPEIRERITQAYIYTLDKTMIEFTVLDHVSGKAKTVKLGEEYDAYKNHLRVKIVGP